MSIMASENEWSESTVRGCLIDEFPGAWGSDPGPSGSNALILRSTNLDDDGHIDFSTAAQRLIAQPDLSQRRLHDGDILLEASGGGPGKPVGRVAHFRAPGANTYLCSNFFRVLRPDIRKVDARFLAWRLLFLHRQPSIWNFQQQTTGIINLKVRDYLEQRFHLPSKPEQTRIAAVLDTVDEAIAKTEAVIAKLKQVRTGLLHDLLTRGLDEHGQLRDPIAHPEQFKDSPLGRIPRNWVLEPLGDRLQRLSGRIQTGPFGSQLHANQYTVDGVPVVMPQDISDGRFDDSQIVRIPSEKARELSRHFMQVGDLIFARRGDLSRCAVVTDHEQDWLCGTGCLLMRFDNQSLSPFWLSLAYRHDIGQRQIAARAVGTTMVNLNTTLLAGLVFAFPPIEEQREMVHRLVESDSSVKCEETNRAKLVLCKAGLMTDLLSGRVRVPRQLEIAT